MSFDKKRSKKEEKDDEEDFEFDENEEEIEDEEEEIEFVDAKMDLDFEGRKPENIHYNGIRTLLHQVFLKLSINVSSLTDLIIKHNDIGSVLQQLSPSDDDSNNEDDMGGDDDDDDDGLVMSVTTVVDISGKTEESEFPKQLRSVLLERCKSLPSGEEFEHFLNGEENRVGLLINERMTGLPPHVAIFESLWKDLEKAKAAEGAENFTHFLLFSKTLRPLVNASKKKKKQDQSAEERIFMNVEEELFHQNSSLTFEFSVKDQCDEALDGTWDDDSSQCYEPFRTVSVVSVDKVPDIMATLATWITSKN